MAYVNRTAAARRSGPSPRRGDAGRFDRGCVETYSLGTAQLFAKTRCGADRGLSRDRFQQRVDAEDGDYPLQMVGEDVRLISVRTRFSPRVRKCVAAIHALMVPNGCSTVCLRMRIASGARSSRCCMRSITPSCSHRLMRRSFPVVHWRLTAQP